VSEVFKGYTCEHCLARFVYGDSLDRHRSRCPQTAVLAARVADLERRIGAAREALRYPGSRYVADVDDLLNLRKPLAKRGKR
jgi:hypothetical protein